MLNPDGDRPETCNPRIAQLEKENAELKQQLAAFHAAMERDKGPKWEEFVKDLAGKLELASDKGFTVAAMSREELKQAGGLLNEMWQCYTHKANFVPSELRIKELEQQLAQAQAACAELRKALSLCSTLGDDGSAFRTFGLADRGYRLVEVRKLAETAIQSSDCGKGWHSPQDWERLEAERDELSETIRIITTDVNYVGGIQDWIKKHDALAVELAKTLNELAEWKAKVEKVEAEAAVMRGTLHLAKEMTQPGYHPNPYRGLEHTHFDLHAAIEKALSTTAGTQLLAKMERWDTLARKVPRPPNAITWEHGVALLNELQDIVWPREALGEQKP